MDNLVSTSEQNPSKKIITSADWERKWTDVKIRKEELNKLVMDFFISKKILEVAKKFREESGTEFGIDNVELVQLQSELIDVINSGAMEHAHKLFYKYFPGLCISNPKVCFLVDLQAVIELICTRKFGEVVEFAQVYFSRWFKEIKEEPSGNWQLKMNEWMAENIEKTMSLLAYEDPELSRTAYVMNDSRRWNLAEQVDETILISQNRGKDPKIHDLLEMLTRVQKDLKDHVDFPQMQFLIAEDPDVPSGDPMLQD